MRTYEVTGMTCAGCERSIERAIKRRLGEDTAVEAAAKTGEVRVESSADPQIVIFTIEGPDTGPTA